MANSKTNLSLELDRVIACRYPASLVTLAKHLAAADTLDIRASISERAPCEVDKLASIVAVALPLWQYTIDILKSLSHSPEFTTHLLIREPGLLDTLLIKATSSQHAFEEYAELCIKLLSRQLPDSVPLPASAQSFFLQVFEQTTATDTLDVSALRSLYYMLNGACRGLVSLLPFQTRQGFDEKLSFILSSPGTGQSSILMLWCFGLTILSEHPDAFSGDLDDRTGSLAAELQWRTKAGRKIFEQGHKTVKLAYLNVLWATKGGVGVADDEALEAIRIASRTLQFVEQRGREGWPTSSAMASDMFARLPSKILRTGIDSGIQLEALRFYASIAGGNRIPPELVAEYGKSIDKTCLVADTQSLKECLSMSLPLFAVQMQEPDLSFILKNILQSNIVSTSALYMENTRILCEEITTICARFPQFRSQMTAALCSSDIEIILQRFLQFDYQKRGQSRQCQSHVEAIRRSLVASTISMVLAAALASGLSKTTLPYATILALLRKQQHLPVISDHCSHLTCSSNPSTVSLFQQECTPLTGTHLQDWKERLNSELDNQNHFQRESVIRSVVQICHDLESRCQTVEAPLRQEREKSNQLANEVASLKREIESLKLKRWEDSEHINALDSDNERLEQERDRITADFARLQTDFRDASTKATEALHEAQARYENMESKLRSSVLEHEEDLRARKIENDDLHDEIRALSDKLHEDESKRRGLIGEAELLQTHLNDLRSKLEMEQEAKSRQDAVVSTLENEASHLRNQLQETETELMIVSDRLSDLQVHHHQLAQDSEANLEKMKKRYDNDMNAAATKAEDEHERLRNELHEARNKRDAIEKAYEKAQANLHQIQTTIPPLHKKVSELNDESLQKDEEIAKLSSSINELRQWRDRIYESMMGLPPHVLSAPRPANEASTSRTAHSHRRRKSSLAKNYAAPEPADTQALSATAMENVANASFTSSGSMASQSCSTPKRPKTRPPFKIPSMHTPYSNKSAPASRQSSKRLSPTKRSVLQAVSPNRRHTTVGFAIPDTEEEQNSQHSLPLRKRRGSLTDGEQLDFDMGSFLVGTPRIPASEAGYSEDGFTTELD